jgi:hypothetical protein
MLQLRRAALVVSSAVAAATVMWGLSTLAGPLG